MNRNFFLAFLFLCLAASLPARGSKENDGGKAAPAPAPTVTVVQVSGAVRLVGSDMFSEIVITGPEHEWYVDKEEISKLKDLQYRTVTVEGEETVREMRFAGGLPAGKRRTLKNIKIISVE